MEKAICKIENGGNINTSILNEMGVPANVGTVLLFSCYCLINGEKHRCIKGALQTAEIEKNKIPYRNAKMQKRRVSLHTKLVVQLHSDSKDYSELVQILFDYMNCENAIYDMIQRYPGESLGCTLHINTANESYSQLVISDPELWDKANKAIQMNYNFDFQRYI